MVPTVVEWYKPIFWLVVCQMIFTPQQISNYVYVRADNFDL